MLEKGRRRMSCGPPKEQAPRGVNLSGKADSTAHTSIRWFAIRGARVTAASEELRQTPLHALHQELGARMVPFAGYAMPVQYPAGLMAEHQHTRNAAGF